MKKILALVVVLLLVPLTAPAQIDYCEGDFDVDGDQDGADAFTFKTDFGRSLLNNPCPPDGQVPLAKTGQTTLYRPNDDGDLEKGVADPVPRFTNPDGSFPVTDDFLVLDNLTGLFWTRLARYSSPMGWRNTFSGLSFMNLGIYSDWRLPNLRELQSLINYGSHNPALPLEHPFDDANITVLWTSTTYDGDSDYAWCVSTETGEIFLQHKTSSATAWPVRGGR